MTFKLHNYKQYNKKVRAFFQGATWKKNLTFLFFLFLSFGFWLLQDLRQSFETKVFIPIQYKNIPTGVVLNDDVPSDVIVKVKGKGTLLLKYALRIKKEDALEINLEGIDFKKSLYTISKTDLESKIYEHLSSAVSLISITPDILHITYQSLEKKELPVVLSGKLTPATGYFLVDTALFTPSKVLVSGTKTLLDSLSAIYTENISIIDIQAPVTKQVKLIIPKGIKLIETNVELNVSAEEYTEKVVRVPIVTKNLPENYKIHIFPSSAEIICSVTLANYGKIAEDDFEVSIDYFELLKSVNYTTIVNLTKKSDRINNYRINPEKVEFLIEEKK